MYALVDFLSTPCSLAHNQRDHAAGVTLSYATEPVWEENGGFVKE